MRLKIHDSLGQRFVGLGCIFTTVRESDDVANLVSEHFFQGHSIREARLGVIEHDVAKADWIEGAACDGAAITGVN